MVAGKGKAKAKKKVSRTAKLSSIAITASNLASAVSTVEELATHSKGLSTLSLRAIKLINKSKKQKQNVGTEERQSGGGEESREIEELCVVTANAE